MNKNRKSEFIISTLERLYPNPSIPLDHLDSYTLLIAVLLSARCTDKRVNKVTPALFNLANNPFDMMSCDIQNIKRIIKPCGLSPFKSKAIKELSVILVEKYNGIVPSNFTQLEALPGINIASLISRDEFAKGS